ncbi:retinal short-chain dehydrogenase/reductase [Stereum hirsutum FP-91666 SS1]|uniref:retinal short-chain dehydrogenase/reductase n=1 Tax=Stereum hirsutum (strain FP-91666) TaxID=721885 RepID=UPI00044494D8|nr:retinal short-chain dehydrogenase/reductase [Stereum hirsutum FP-91666 SS1]EIM85656.1 retinal short-chain dehydrogenase/reductase [Stereum hirsutum FP-91666 SS1]
MEAPAYTAGQVYDSFDIDLVIKVMNNTLLSPFFCFLIPVFFMFQGYTTSDLPVLVPFGWVGALAAFWGLKWYSRLYRNQGSLLFGPAALDWGEQIVVVTGGSSGIGELIANTLAVRNVTVVVLDVNPIVTENYNIVYYKCDVSKWEEVEAVSKKIVEELGHPTVLINNAGVVQGKLLIDLSPEDVQQTIGVNTLAHFWTLKAFLPEMIKNKAGHIITVSSVAGLVGMAQMTDYNASKAATISLHESLRYELDKRYLAPEVRTTLLVPGHIQTPLFSTTHFPQNFLFKFFVPSLQPITIAKAVIAALDEQHSRTIYLPFYVNFVPVLRLLPSFLRDFAQWLSYADYAMDGFVKVSGRRQDEGPLVKQEKQTSKAE